LILRRLWKKKRGFDRAELAICETQERPLAFCDVCAGQIRGARTQIASIQPLNADTEHGTRIAAMPLQAPHFRGAKQKREMEFL
jgi:hypothetical protein